MVLSDPSTSRKYSTEGMVVMISPYTFHTDPTYWPRPSEFLPERWLPSTSISTSPAPDTQSETENLLRPSEREAWRPFGRGPRACIGQELVLTELKLILALTAREFDVASMYEEINREKKGKKDFNGDPAWMTMGILGRPREGMPVRVRLLETKEGVSK